MVSDQSPLPQASRFACHQPQPLAHPYLVEHPMCGPTTFHLRTSWVGWSQSVLPPSTIKQPQTDTHIVLHILTLSRRCLKTTTVLKMLSGHAHMLFFCISIRCSCSLSLQLQVIIWDPKSMHMCLLAACVVVHTLAGGLKKNSHPILVI